MVRPLNVLLGAYPLLSRFILLLLLPLAGALWWTYASLQASLPARQLRLNGPALAGQLSITRNADGVPAIDAVSDNDAYYAVGYAHGQDRLWQLELQRRIAQGRLSEVFGKDSVQQDIWFRTLGLYASARSAWPALSKPAQASLTAYAAGVNAAIAAQDRLPPEFGILKLRPEPWTEIDSLAWVKMFAFDLGGNFRSEIARSIAGRTLAPQQLLTFFPNYPPGAPTTIAASAPGMNRLLAFQDQLETGLHLGGRAVGSNAWVVAGRLSANGATMLANDPHLGLSIPSLWYAVDVRAKSLKVSGMSLVGLPLVIFGHNDHIAWGGTNMMADAQDLYLERPDPADPLGYQVDGRSERMTSHVEEIMVRPDFPSFLRKPLAPVRVTVRNSRHGPIISDQFKLAEHLVSLRWTALDAGDTSYEAFFQLGYARDWKQFNAALHQLVAPAMNMVYADDKGNIGYLGAGRLPLRASGDGTLPSPGWQSDSAWRGYVAPDKWPSSYNPPAGYIVTANNKVVSEDYPYFISHDWASPARAERIGALLDQAIQGGHKLTMDDMQHMQRDTVDLEARAMAAQLANYTPHGEAQAAAWRYLKDWDGDMAANSQAAAIFHVWMRHLRLRLFDPHMKGNWNDGAQGATLASLAAGVSLDQLRQIIAAPASPWCAAPGQPSAPCTARLSAAFDDALAELRKLSGSANADQWRWSSLHTTVYTHAPFSHVKPFDKVFEQRLASGGSDNTINVAPSRYSEKEGYLQHIGASFRQVIGMDRGATWHRYMNSTGQSGNPASSHYADMVAPFGAGDLHTLAAPGDGGQP